MKLKSFSVKCSCLATCDADNISILHEVFPSSKAQPLRKSDWGRNKFSMASTEESKRRILNFNVGVLGHIDSGKTSLSKALSTTASTASFDKNPQSKERGITLDLGFSSFAVSLPDHLKSEPYDVLQFTLVDCPGHASLIKTIIGIKKRYRCCWMVDIYFNYMGGITNRFCGFLWVPPMGGCMSKSCQQKGAGSPFLNNPVLATLQCFHLEKPNYL